MLSIISIYGSSMATVNLFVSSACDSLLVSSAFDNLLDPSLVFKFLEGLGISLAFDFLLGLGLGETEPC